MILILLVTFSNSGSQFSVFEVAKYIISFKDGIGEVLNSASSEFIWYHTCGVIMVVFV